MMRDLLGQATSMEVIEVGDETPVAPGKVYLLPSTSNVIMKSATTFALRPRPDEKLNLPIDLFLNSAAAYFDENLIAVILSGAGSDGCRGIAAVNSRGGLVLAQSPEDAQFDGMPKAAISTGFVDESGSAEFLAQRTIKYLQRHQLFVPGIDSRHSPETQRVVFEDLLTELRKRTGIPFDEYKRSTLLRRIRRRLAVRHLNNLDEYLALLRSSPTELDHLRHELLIGVTSFFRDQEPFEELKNQIRTMVDKKEESDTIRVWVAGCSTGEEAYSIGVIISECLAAAGKNLEYKIFATDLEQSSLDLAAQGTYPRAITGEVSADRLRDFFREKIEGYQIVPEIRRNIVFARHNMTVDAPFTGLDLISCRNVLIYFTAPLQTRLLKRFQYGLNPDGILFLGRSESLGSMSRNFLTYSTTANLFRPVFPGALEAEALVSTGAFPEPPPEETSRATTARPDWIVAGEQYLLGQLMPPSLLVLMPQQEIIRTFGNINPFLEIPSGETRLDPAQLKSQAGARVLHSMLTRFHAGAASEASEPVPQDGAGSTDLIRIRLTTAPEAPFRGKLILLSFIQSAVETRTVRPEASPSTATSGTQLYQQLLDTRERLTETIDALEASNEELKSTNEELLASNEELQSTNEEMQSVNEELYVVNAEYLARIRSLDIANREIDLLSTASRIPTLQLDEKLHIVRFSAAIRNIYALRQSDIGKPLELFPNLLGYIHLTTDARAAIATNQPRDVYWREHGGQSFIVRFVPLEGAGSGTTSLLILFIDVSAAERADFLKNILDGLKEQIIVVDENGNITLVNEAYLAFARDNNADTNKVGIGVNYLAVCRHQVDGKIDSYADSASDGLKRVLNGVEQQFHMEYPIEALDRRYAMEVRALPPPLGGAVISHSELLPPSRGQV